MSVGRTLYGADYRDKDHFNRMHLYFGGAQGEDTRPAEHQCRRRHARRRIPSYVVPPLVVCVLVLLIPLCTCLWCRL